MARFSAKEANSNWIDGRTICRKLIPVKSCAECGRKKNLDVHHIIPATYIPGRHSPTEGNHSPENLKVLCRSCHRKWHNRQKEKTAYEIGTCKICMKMFYYRPTSQFGKFCSRKCLYNRGQQSKELLALKRHFHYLLHRKEIIKKSKEYRERRVMNYASKGV